MMALKYLALTALIILNACTSSRARMENFRANITTAKLMSVSARKEQLQTVRSWEILGAMAARNKKDAWTASINWQQDNLDHYQIHLSGPLNNGTIIINKQDGLVTYRDSSKLLSSTNAESLLKQQTGIALPVTHLYYWVRGLPAPGNAESFEYDKANHLKQFEQAGYTIQYLSYSSVNGIELPRQIHLQSNELKIKFVVKQWKIIVAS